MTTLLDPFNTQTVQSVPGIMQPQTQAAPATQVATSNPSQSIMAPTYSAEQVAVNPQSTVAGQVQSIINQDSPLMQSAQTKALQESNQRGLVNSSMGVQAGGQAVINAALPIAMQDAQTNANAATANAGATNQARQFGAGAQLQADTANQQDTSQTNRFNAANAQQSYMQGAQFQQDEQMFGRDEALKKYLQSAEYTQQQAIQAQDFAGKAVAQTAQYQQDEQMFGKEEALRRAMQTGEYFQQTAMFNLDAAQKNLMQTSQYAQDVKMFGEDAALRQALQSNDYAQQIAVQANEFASQKAMQTSQFLQAEKMVGREEAFRLATQSSQFMQDKAMFTLDENLKKFLVGADIESRKAIALMDNDVKIQLASIQADYQTLNQTSASATTMFASTLSEIGKVVQDENMDGTAKATAINGYMGWLKNGMNLVSSINGVDTSGLLDFGAVTAG